MYFFGGDKRGSKTNNTKQVRMLMHTPIPVQSTRMYRDHVSITLIVFYALARICSHSSHFSPCLPRPPTPTSPTPSSSPFCSLSIDHIYHVSVSSWWALSPCSLWMHEHVQRAYIDEEDRHPICILIIWISAAIIIWIEMWLLYVMVMRWLVVVGCCCLHAAHLGLTMYVVAGDVAGNMVDNLPKIGLNTLEATS